MMDSQCAPLDKGLAAVAVHTLVWPLVGVYPVVALEVGLAVEALQRELAHVTGPYGAYPAASTHLFAAGVRAGEGLELLRVSSEVAPVVNDL